MIRLRPTAWLVSTLFFVACASLSRVERAFVPVGDVRGRDLSEALGLETGSDAYLKGHMIDGRVYVVQARTMETSGDRLVGEGMLLGVNRDTLFSGRVSVPLDSVVLFETNTLVSSGASQALSIVTGVSVVVTAFCAANPKACFGSCPTFYSPGEKGQVLRAEGFSGSISPSLEATDVDALFGVSPVGGVVELEMRNEALETHVIRWADVLAIRRNKGTRVLQDPAGRFWEITGLRSPVRCKGREGDCLHGVESLDGIEYLSLADSLDLGTQEYVHLELEVEGGKEYGLVLGARQSLLPTFLLYQAFAYMGREAGGWLARIERSEPELGNVAIQSLFNTIEVQVPTSSGDWVAMGTLGEHGPLAVDLQVLPLPARSASGIQSVRLRLTQGAWRLDYVGVGEMISERFPERIRPTEVLRAEQRDPAALDVLLDPEESLTTLPGESYILRYPMPEGRGETEIFLETRGYYLEWIREEWLAEEDPARLVELLFDSGTALKKLAPVFKGVESGMEAAFWRSRYASKK